MLVADFIDIISLLVLVTVFIDTISIVLITDFIDMVSLVLVTDFINIISLVLFVADFADSILLV